MDFLSLDIETTGTDVRNNSIVQIAAEFHQNGQVVSTFNRRFYDGYSEVNIGALRVNKLTMKKLTNIANPTIALAGTDPNANPAHELIDYLLSLPIKGQLTILGQNVAFDIQFIKHLLEQNRITGWDSLVSYRVLDTGTIATFLKDAGLIPLEKTSLGDLVKFFGIEVPNTGLHDAANDAKVTAQVYYKFLDMVRVKTDTLTRSTFAK